MISSVRLIVQSSRTKRTRRFHRLTRLRDAKLSRSPRWGWATGTTALGGGVHKSIFSGYHDSDPPCDDYHEGSPQRHVSCCPAQSPAEQRPPKSPSSTPAALNINAR